MNLVEANIPLKNYIFTWDGGRGFLQLQKLLIKLSKFVLARTARLYWKLISRSQSISMSLNHSSDSVRPPGNWIAFRIHIHGLHAGCSRSSFLFISWFLLVRDERAHPLCGRRSSVGMGQASAAVRLFRKQNSDLLCLNKLDRLKCCQNPDDRKTHL